MVGEAPSSCSVMPPFQSLKVWQHAQRLAVECHRAARRFPQEDRGIIADQLVRAASSVPLNIAEGSARKGSKEFRRFLDEIEAAVPGGLEVHLIWDNYATHKTATIRNWLAVWL